MRDVTPQCSRDALKALATPQCLSAASADNNGSSATRGLLFLKKLENNQTGRSNLGASSCLVGNRGEMGVASYNEENCVAPFRCEATRVGIVGKLVTQTQGERR